MSRKSLVAVAAGVGILAAAIALAGCNNQQPGHVTDSASGTPSTEQSAASTHRTSTAEKDVTDEHAHKPGAHGGIIVSLGRDSYHVEAVFEQGGLLRLHVLGSDETKVQEIDAQDLLGYIKASDANEAIAVVFKPQPQPGDTAGKTSVFVGRIPADLVGKNLDVTVPSVRIAGERFRLGFTSTPQSHGEDIMPDKVGDDEERDLYLKPGGLYTEADIKANGNATASQKFAGFKSSHDMKPKPGDKICPVTMTKANPKCTWVVGGKTYEFCCPPCVDEFVKLAKENPNDVKDPDAYVKR
ncbi:MAG: hypothetical protein DCC68_11840 [Planctomycetota bacterium]|nr:MAG: hypothetical protein DCC68_11840 [Planctomycetota bacterium]